MSVPTSWSLRRISHSHLFECFERYRKEDLEMIGTVELYDDRSELRWDADVRRPAESRFWIAIFENRRG